MKPGYALGVFIFNPLRSDVKQKFQGVQWLSGRVLDSRSKDCGFEPHMRLLRCVLEQDTIPA